ncbi:MAG TPA: hypothetical protein VL225_01275 [Vicinamibacterales bacterium]|nr:hypothetical protein [Vicinamibacterales bacterium]
MAITVYEMAVAYRRGGRKLIEMRLARRLQFHGRGTSMEPNRISPQDAKRRLDAGEPITFLDSRAPDAWKHSDRQIPGSIRVPPDEVQPHLHEIPRDGLLVSYCT